MCVCVVYLLFYFILFYWFVQIFIFFLYNSEYGFWISLIIYFLLLLLWSSLPILLIYNEWRLNNWFFYSIRATNLAPFEHFLYFGQIAIYHRNEYKKTHTHDTDTLAYVGNKLYSHNNNNRIKKVRITAVNQTKTTTISTHSTHIYASIYSIRFINMILLFACVAVVLVLLLLC